MTSGVSLVDALKAIRSADLCDGCEKPRGVINVRAITGGRGTHLERVSSATHCACAPTATREAGPAYVAPSGGA